MTRATVFRRLKLCSRSSQEGRCLPIRASKFVGKRAFTLADFCSILWLWFLISVLILFFTSPLSEDFRTICYSMRDPLLFARAEARCSSTGRVGQSTVFKRSIRRLSSLCDYCFFCYLFPFLLYKSYYAANDCDSFSMPLGMKVETTMMKADSREVRV